jgi:hypothetical protein
MIGRVCGISMTEGNEDISVIDRHVYGLGRGRIGLREIEYRR